MKTLWCTLHQHMLALRIWWYCKRDKRLAQRVQSLIALLQQDTDATFGHLH